MLRIERDGVMAIISDDQIDHSEEIRELKEQREELLHKMHKLDEKIKKLEDAKCGYFVAWLSYEDSPCREFFPLGFMLAEEAKRRSSKLYDYDIHCDNGVIEVTEDEFVKYELASRYNKVLTLLYYGDYKDDEIAALAENKYLKIVETLSDIKDPSNDFISIY